MRGRWAAIVLTATFACLAASSSSATAQPLSPAIIGGELAKPGTFPWLASITDYRGDVVGECTGTVVAPRLILTAGHCAENTETGVVNEASGYEVVTGNVDREGIDRQTLRVSNVIVYPYFETSGLLKGWGDAALLVLQTPTTAPAIALAKASESALWEPGTPAIMAGWGETFYGQELPTEVLRWAETAVRSSEYCEVSAPGFHPLGQLCVIDPPSYSTGGCFGDSGGPLLVQSATGEPVEIGILRSVYGECLTTMPTVYTRASMVASWVSSWIQTLRREEEAAAKKRQEEEAAAAAAKKRQEEEAAAAAAKKRQEEEAAA
ncbi:MAG: S1 family peptidase, partial [Solirubrobacteraceae bacterium]